MTKIKICGLTREEDILAVNDYLPDYIGFVFAKSKRQLSLSQAKHLKGLLSPRIQTVGVFVNEPIETLVHFEQEQVIDIVQLHGDEDEGYIAELKENINLPIIKAVRVKKQVEAIPSYDTEFLLFDKYLEQCYGGGGSRFDWQTLKGIIRPYFLAGGIDLSNIHEALGKSPYAIDVSSGVETNGIKDREKIRQMIEITRSHQEKSIK
jgi:phosphoribosylanthranilate isomerase